MAEISIHDREWNGKFSEREKKFLVAYASSGDMVEAATDAGYDPGAVSWVGQKIMGRPESKLELNELKKELGKDAGSMDFEELVKEFKIVATASIKDFYDEEGNVIDVTEMDPVKARAIKEIKRTVNPKNGHVTVTVTMHDKISALQNLGRMGGHYAADNGQSNGDVNILLNVPGGMASL